LRDRGHWSEAKQRLERILDRDRENEYALHLLMDMHFEAWACGDRKACTDALTRLEELKRIDPYNLPALVSRFEWALKAEHADPSVLLKEFDEALRGFAKNPYFGAPSGQWDHVPDSAALLSHFLSLPYLHSIHGRLLCATGDTNTTRGLAELESLAATGDQALRNQSALALARVGKFSRAKQKLADCKDDLESCDARTLNTYAAILRLEAHSRNKNGMDGVVELCEEAFSKSKESLKKDPDNLYTHRALAHLCRFWRGIVPDNELEKTEEASLDKVRAGGLPVDEPSPLWWKPE
jgi:tetratricopeptide (TPR) repeat protein